MCWIWFWFKLVKFCYPLFPNYMFLDWKFSLWFKEGIIRFPLKESPSICNVLLLSKSEPVAPLFWLLLKANLATGVSGFPEKPSLLLAYEFMFLIFICLKWAVSRISESEDPANPEPAPCEAPPTEFVPIYIRTY